MSILLTVLLKMLQKNRPKVSSISDWGCPQQLIKSPPPELAFNVVDKHGHLGYSAYVNTYMECATGSSHK